MTPKKRNQQFEYPAMLDAVLRNFASLPSRGGSGGNSPAPPINWEALSQAIPDTSPEMCERRFVELRNQYLITQEQAGYAPETLTQPSSKGGGDDPLYNYVRQLFHKDEKERRRALKLQGRSLRNEEEKEQEYEDATNTDCDTRSTTPSPFPASSTLHNVKLQGGPSMVIHVCDEAKNLRQDFTCPRDLLIQEMRYFAEYLSVDSQRLEEVDISVHCDIHIFDWLMRYVKRNSGLTDASDQPKLEPSNVVSILISSDFLKMDSLVEECIEYCRCNLSAIVSTPCNMNCVNEKLTERIAGRLGHCELEEVKDRKDKFKSKLFCRKIEKLFDAEYDNPDSRGNASTLFRCKYCGRILTCAQIDKLPCTNNRMRIDGKGMLSYEHDVDPVWDVSNYITSLHEELKKWALVYWRLWGIVNNLFCSRCDQTFQLCEFCRCQYHPERPQFRQLLDMQVTDNAVGLYPCCNQRVLRFDPTGLSKGCRFRDHVVTAASEREQKLLDDLQTYKHLVEMQNPIHEVPSDLNIFSTEESLCGVLEPTSTPAEIVSPPMLLQVTKPAVSTKVQRTVSPSDQYYTGLADNSEEDTGEEEPSPKLKSKPQTTSLMSAISTNASTVSTKPPATFPMSVAITPSAGAKPAPTGKKAKDKAPQHVDDTMYKNFPSKQKWEASRSIRWNQDVQREEDLRRIQEMTMQLSKQRVDKADRSKTKDVRDYPGGIFSKLEANFYASLRPGNAGMGSGRQAGGNSNRDNRLRGRQTQIPFI